MKRKINIPGFKETFYVYHTIGDGSCLIHSILHSFNKTYRNSDNTKRREMADNLRSLLAGVLTEKEDEKTELLVPGIGNPLFFT